MRKSGPFDANRSDVSFENEKSVAPQRFFGAVPIPDSGQEEQQPLLKACFGDQIAYAPVKMEEIEEALGIQAVNYL